jgi:hypothetical protein
MNTVERRCSGYLPTSGCQSNTFGNEFHPILPNLASLARTRGGSIERRHTLSEPLGRKNRALIGYIFRSLGVVAQWHAERLINGHDGAAIVSCGQRLEHTDV